MPHALIVEDEPHARELLAMVLGLHGFHSDSVGSGAEGLAIFDPARHDAVCLDIMLPDLDGFALCKTLRARRASAITPVVLITALMAPDVRLRAETAGASALVSKPYMPDHIYRGLDDAMAWSRSLQDTPADGSATLRPVEPILSARLLNTLRALLLTRTSIDESAIDSMIGAIESLVSDALHTAETSGRDDAVRVEYQIDGEHILIRLVDLSDWLGDDPIPSSDLSIRFPSLSQAFDRVISSDGPSLLLARDPQPVS